MTEKTLIRWVVILALTVISNFAEAQTPSPALLVLDRGDPATDGGDKASMVIIDPRTNKTVGSVPVGESPHALAVSEDGKLAFVTNKGWKNQGHTISVVDIVAQKELRRVDLGPVLRPCDVVVGGGKVYFTIQVSRLIGRYDPASNKVDWLLGGGQDFTHELGLTKDLRHIFTTNLESGSVTAFESVPPHYSVDPPDWKSTTIPVPNGPEGIDISPDGKEVWVAQQDAGTVAIIDVASKKMTQTVDIQTKLALRLRFTPDGKRVVISDEKSGELVIVDAVARKVIKRINVGNMPINVMVTPDGLHAYVGVTRDSNVAVIDLKTLELTGHIPVGDQSHLPFKLKDATGYPSPSGPSGIGWSERK